MIRSILLLTVVLSPAFSHASLDGPLTPEQAVASFRLDPGLKIECVASEPMVVSPVAVAWDERGRMFVVEDRGYPIGPGKGQKPAGQVVLLESSKHDGHYDKRTVYSDGLTFPNGVMCWNGGIFVTCAPYLYYFKDTKGDGVADVRQIIFSGFQDASTTQLRVSHPVLNIDNWVYLTSGLTDAQVKSPIYTNHPVVNCRRTDFRFRPDTDEFEPNAGTAQFGETFDNFGRKFICSNRNHNQVVMLQLNYLSRNRDFAFSDVVQDTPDHGAASRVYPLSADITTIALHTGYFTSACGVFCYRGDALPPEYRDNCFTCEPAGNLVHRDVITPTNSTFVARRAQEGVEFLASPDNWCRPVNLASGPDGALYVCDMYRKTIEHPDYLPEATRKITDFDSGKNMGRIYRITSAKAKSKPQKFDLAADSVKQLCAGLKNPDAWWRTAAQRLLLERQDKAAVPLLASLLKHASQPETRVLAVYLLQSLGALTDQQIELAIADKHPGVRENGLKLAELRLVDSPLLTGRVLAMAEDPDPRVRFQCALSLGALTNSSIVPALAKITTRDVADRWTRAAVLTAIDHHSDELLHRLLAVPDKDSEGMSAMLVELCRIVGVGEPPEKLSALLAEVAASTDEKDRLWEEAAITGMADGLRTRGFVTNGLSPLKTLTSGDSASALLARARVQDLVQHAMDTARGEQRPLLNRLVAVGLLAQTDFASAGSLLEDLVDPRQPAEIQVASIRALGHMSDPAAGAALVTRERWQGYTPPVREAVLALLMSQPELIKTLLKAMENGAVPPWSVNEDRRTQLMRSRDESIKARAVALFKEMKGSDRMKVYQEYKSILDLKPNPQNGHAVFSRTCTGCHVFAGEGKTVGPDLTGIRNQPADVLLLHIIIPEYEIMPTYTCYNVETKDGRTLTGLLAGETPSNVTLRLPLAVDETIARSNIASMAASSLSLMPDGLENGMTRQDMADLISFLKGM